MSLPAANPGVIIAYILVVGSFLLMAVLNIKPVRPFVEGYASWGYPGWWHYLVALLDAAGVLLMLFQSTRLWGAALLTLVTVGAIATLLRFGEYKASLPAWLLLSSIVLIMYYN